MRTNLNNPQPNPQPQPQSNYDFRQYRSKRGGRFRRNGYERPARVRVTEPVIQHNMDMNSTEIRFPNAPSEAMRKHMSQDLKWKWSSWNCCWYKRNARFVDNQEQDIAAEVMAEAQELVNRYREEMHAASTNQVEEGVMVS